MKKIDILIIILVLFSCCALFICGYYIGQDNYEPKIITEYETIEVVKWKTIKEICPIYVDKEVVTVKYIDKIVPVMKQQRYFESLEELKSFLEEDNTDNTIILIFNADGVVNFDGQCEDFAMQLQTRALEQGFILSTEIDKYKNLPFFTLSQSHPEADHMFNAAVIPSENAVYWIEPTTDEIHYWGRLD